MMVFLLPAQIMLSILTQAHKKLFQISGCVKVVVAHQRGQATRGQAEQSCLLVLQCCQHQGNCLLLLYSTMKATRPLTLNIILGSYLERDFDILSIPPRYFFPLNHQDFQRALLKNPPFDFLYPFSHCSSLFHTFSVEIFHTFRAVQSSGCLAEPLKLSLLTFLPSALLLPGNEAEKDTPAPLQQVMSSPGKVLLYCQKTTENSFKNQPQVGLNFICSQLLLEQ